MKKNKDTLLKICAIVSTLAFLFFVGIITFIVNKGININVVSENSSVGSVITIPEVQIMEKNISLPGANFDFKSFQRHCDADLPVSASGCINSDSFQINGKNFPFKLSGGKFKDGCLEFNRAVTLTFRECDTEPFNYFALRYSCNACIKGTITYSTVGVKKSEDFFLEDSKSADMFYGFIDDCLNGVTATALVSLRFECLNADSAKMSIYGFALFNREVPEKMVYVDNGNLKLGANLDWGGAISYLEDLNSAVQVIEKDGEIHVDSNAAERYGVDSLSNSVNLINCFDAGRLVQQSYYGTDGSNDKYKTGQFMEKTWPYNPVQGGNQFNDQSKIVDVTMTDNMIYIKCRPMDWSKSKECITPSYMEAVYELDGNSVKAFCRFVDFSNYSTRATSQELPAFYTLAPFDTFVYYSGDSPWTDDPVLTKRDDLYFWPEMGYPHFNTTENWSAFVGEFDDSFGVGLWVPGQTSVLAGINAPGQTRTAEPAVENSTSYIGVTQTHTLQSFVPFEYYFRIATGNINEIRSEFAKTK